MSAKYHVDNEAGVRCDQLEFITDVSLNFYQLWAFFGCLPIVHCKGGTGVNEYTWFIRGPKSNFAIVGYNTSLLKTKRWRIMTDVNDDILTKAFLENLLDAIQCYHMWYSSIDTHQFSSPRHDIHQILQTIKGELKQIKDIVKQL